MKTRTLASFLDYFMIRQELATILVACFTIGFPGMLGKPYNDTRVPIYVCI